jgi:hypothetical protein
MTTLLDSISVIGTGKGICQSSPVLQLTDDSLMASTWYSLKLVHRKTEKGSALEV